MGFLLVFRSVDATNVDFAIFLLDKKAKNIKYLMTIISYDVIYKWLLF